MSPRSRPSRAVSLESFASLVSVPGLRHGISTRALAREAVPEALGHPGPLRTAHQVHRSAIVAVDGSDTPIGEADGLSTDRPGALLGVLGADCPGVLLVAPEARVLAVVHAGWRGVVAGIVPGAIHLLAARYGVAAGDLIVGIGPGISQANYEVSDEVAESLAASVGEDAQGDVIEAGRPGHAFADLRAAIRAQLLQRGVPSASIETHPACTFDDAERFHSHRRDGENAGRHLLVAGWL